MTWLTLYRLKLYYENSIWILPVLAALVAIAVVRIIDRFERYEGWRSLIRPETAQAVLATMTALACLPALALLPLLRRYLIKGLSLGALK